MRETRYEAEKVLQELIARFPSLLAGDQYSGDIPRRWLLVGREAALPDDQDAAGRWSVDHLFLDQDAVPTLVEVKRSSDSRIRREVVGQMLDYAANGVVYWPLEQLRELFARQCEHDDDDPDLVISELVGEETDVEDFWARVGENLRAGKVRMVFVSDEIPRELRRVVEFLNGQMNPAEVIAIEVKQYVGADGTKTLVPRVIGQTAEVEARKGRAPRRAVSALTARRCSPSSASRASWPPTQPKPFSTGQTASRGLRFATPSAVASSVCGALAAGSSR